MSLQAVARLADDLHALELLELKAELVAGELLVVDHHGTYAHAETLCGAVGTGISMRAHVPSPGVLSSRNG